MSANARTPLWVHRDHRRDFAENVYVYAVVSRRSKGVSVGLNLNPDKVCNFDCVYCQVDRTTPGPTRALRGINDIAFCGDGEQTTWPEFPQLVEAVVEVKRRRGLGGVKIVVITNATMFHRPAVRDALAVLAANGGEVWAKLDAGTE